jgi:4-hydroxyphenylpyruvate dioxygenase-like putative hemolysin
MRAFGEGNFCALLESVERDRIRRGVLKPEMPAEPAR